MFESIFTATASDNAISITSSLIGIAVALILGIVISCVYMYICKKDGYSKSFIIGLVILPAIVAVVILLIGSNVARAFSMAGAFALVRFRSAPGNARDISVVFFAMASGLACGLGYVVFACLFVVIMLAVLLVLNAVHFAESKEVKKQLKITIPETLNYTNTFDDIFDKYLTSRTLKKVRTTNMGTMFELTYNVNMKNDIDEKNFIDELRTRNGNLNIIMGIAETNSDILN
jgi:hypothetical protein